MLVFAQPMSMFRFCTSDHIFLFFLNVYIEMLRFHCGTAGVCFVFILL